MATQAETTECSISSSARWSSSLRWGGFFMFGGQLSGPNQAKSVDVKIELPKVEKK